MFNRIVHMLIKEFLQLKRDRWGWFRLTAPTIIQVLVFGYAATFEVFHVSTVVIDHDHSQESRQLVARFTGSGRFDMVAALNNNKQMRQWIDRGRATVAIQIHPGFSEKLLKGQRAPVQVVVDGTDSNTALIALGYIGQIAARFGNDYRVDMFNRLAPAYNFRLPSITMEARPWYNPNLDSRWFFVPGVVGSIVFIIVVTLTAFAIVREREVGTLEQIMVTPVRPVEFILGKTAPFFLIGLAEVGLVTLVGTLWFGIPFHGSVFVLLLGTSAFLVSSLAIGLFISTISKTQQQAFAAAFFFLFPAFTLSGFAFPISSMPQAMQWLTYLDPLRYYLVVIRGIFLKGTGVEILWPQMVAMAVLGVALLSLSAVRFRKSLD